MYTRQLPVGGGTKVPGNSGNGGYPNNAAHGPNYGANYASNPRFAGPVTYVYQPIAPTNSVAIVGMVLSLVCLTTSFVPAGIAGIIMGHVARKQIRKRGERGDAMALTALWVGYLSVGFWGIFWLLYIGVMVLAIMMGVAEGQVS